MKIAFFTLVLFCVFLVGCVKPDIELPVAPEPAQKLSYREIAMRYNANVAKIDRLWARTVVEIEWRDSKKKHFEQGDGLLMLMLPHNLAFTVGKVGEIGLWAGSDLKRYWLMDLGDKRIAYVGEHAKADRLSTDDLPVPVRPLELVQLLGIAPLDPDLDQAGRAVGWENGCYVVADSAAKSRIWIDATEFRARRIDLLDQKGGARISCQLTHYEPMEIEKLPPGALPKIATRLAINVAARGRSPEAKMSISLSDPTDGREDDKIRDKVFDFESLKRSLKVADVIDLDAVKK